MSNINESSIVNLIRKGDSSAYLMLYENYAPLLYGIIFRTVKNQALAEKILEKTMMSVWQDRASISLDKPGFSMRLINMARSFARNEHEKKGTKASVSTRSDILELVITKGLNIKQAADCLRISISDALLKLRKELKQSTSLKN